MKDLMKRHKQIIKDDLLVYKMIIESGRREKEDIIRFLKKRGFPEYTSALYAEYYVGLLEIFNDNEK